MLDAKVPKIKGSKERRCEGILTGKTRVSSWNWAKCSTSASTTLLGRAYLLLIKILINNEVDPL